MPVKQRLPISIYAMTIFVSSALLMILEIVAGRLLAPYIGVSLYTWTSIIGVILAGLSIGNWIGGVWSDRGGDQHSVASVLILSGTASIAVLFLLTIIAPYLQVSSLSPMSASFLYVVTLFMFPALLLGIITPLLTTMALKQSSRTGHIVGMMHALAAAGSIVGTFLAGYWLIQYMGTHNLIVLTSIVLYLLSLPFLLFKRRYKIDFALLILAIIVFSLTYHRNGFASPCKKESQYFCIRIVSATDMVPQGFANAMVLDHLMHGVNHATYPDMLVYPYLHALDELIKLQLGNQISKGSFFFAGGGSYTHPRALKYLYPEANVTVAEIDPVVTAMASDYMNVDTNRLKIFHDDARLVLRQSNPQQFDVVVGDVFHDVTLPYHLTTLEYVQLVKSRLKPDGMYSINIVDNDNDPMLVKSIYKTLQQKFRHVDIWLEKNTRQAVRQTYVISATDKQAFPDQFEATRGFPRNWEKVTDRLLRNGTTLTELPVLTDQYAPVERLIASLVFNRY